ncbi:hypothetical protein PMAYCL1PPCAC_07034, partial [Pristionchus mayeri]
SMADDGNIPGTNNSYRQPEATGIIKRKSLFISRDYSKGLGVRFDRNYPPQLHGLISEEEWSCTIDKVNEIFEDAEKVCAASVAETMFGCLTCYIFRCFTQTHYEKKLFELNEFLDERNHDVFGPVGLLLRDPMHRGLRVVSTLTSYIYFVIYFFPFFSVRNRVHYRGRVLGIRRVTGIYWLFRLDIFI